ncbi:hypothetical protein SH2C18_26110 [Clostridium sediminicola]|uniref:DUF3232 domain-containing protein n=1 Tax=Clostridium sediminicola TaxID=3114879 RepID=UPI0031F1D38C
MQLCTIKELVSALISSEDDDCIDIVEELIVSAGKYIELICEMEGATLVGRYTKEFSENREYIKKLNERTIILREEFKANLKIINRLCNKDSIPHLYEGNINEEKELKVIAMDLIRNLSAV